MASLQARRAPPWEGRAGVQVTEGGGGIGQARNSPEHELPYVHQLPSCLRPCNLPQGPRGITCTSPCSCPLIPLRTQARSLINIYTHTHTHMQAHADSHTSTHPHVHACIRGQVYTCTNKHTQIHTQTCSHKHSTFTYAHKHKRSHGLAHTPMCGS